MVAATKYEADGGGTSALPFLMTGLECDGTETSLERCAFDGWNLIDCRSQKAAAVVCSTQPTGIEARSSNLLILQSANNKLIP